MTFKITEHDLTDAIFCQSSLASAGSGTRAEARQQARRMLAADDLLAICEEIANDSRVDLVDSERRIRLYSAIKEAKGEF